MEGAPVCFKAIEGCEASGIPIPAGAYFGKQKIHVADDDATKTVSVYSLEIVERGTTLDVTPLVELGQFTVVPVWP